MSRRAAPGLNSKGGLAEVAFQAQVIGLLRVYGWRLIYHAPDNRPAGRTGRPQRLAAPEGKGFPDLVAVRAPRLLFAELKTKGGRVAPEQREWLAELDAVAAAVRVANDFAERALDALGAVAVLPRVEAHLWTPDDWDTLHDVIRGAAQRRDDLDPPPATRALY